MQLENKTIAILATNGFEQSELFVPLKKLRDAGATVHVVSPQKGAIRGWDSDDWGESVDVDIELESASPGDYDALVLPGGQINPDLLRVNPKAVEFVRAFSDAQKPIGAICHAPWLLIEAGIIAGKRATSYPSIRTDMENASAQWLDEEVVIDGRIVTSRKPADLDAFCKAVADVVAQAGSGGAKESGRAMT